MMDLIKTYLPPKSWVSLVSGPGVVAFHVATASLTVAFSSLLQTPIYSHIVCYCLIGEGITILTFQTIVISFVTHYSLQKNGKIAAERSDKNRPFEALPNELLELILRHVELKDLSSFALTSKRHTSVANLAFLKESKEFYLKLDSSGDEAALEAKNFLRNLCQDVQKLRACLPKKYRIYRKKSLNPFSNTIKPISTLKNLHSIDSSEIFSLFKKASEKSLPKGRGLFLAKYLLQCTELGIIGKSEFVHDMSFALEFKPEEDLTLFTLLLAHGGDPKPLDRGIYGCANLLEYAIQREKYALLKLFLENSKYTSSIEKISDLLFNALTNNPKTKKEIVNLLLEKGANINYRAFLMNAVQIRKNNKLVNSLLGIKGIRVNAQNASGETALHLAIFELNNCTPKSAEEEKLIQIIISLIKNKADVNLPDNQGISPFIYTLILNCYDAAKWLIENSEVAVNFTIQGHHSLFYAIFANSKGSNSLEGWKTTISMIKTLFEKEVGINLRDEKGRTPLIFAAYLDKTEIVKTLLQAHDINLNAQDQKGRTALYFAVKNHNLQMIRALIAKGADPHIINDKGISAFNLANQHPPDIKNSLLSLF